MMERLVEQMKEKQGVTEELKMQNQMAWVGRMNNIRACAEEIVVKEIVYYSKVGKHFIYRKIPIILEENWGNIVV